MPTRLVREGIINSDRIEQLDCPAEVFYRRLLNKVDDHGLYDARPSVLRSSLYPLRVDRVREADCTRWLAACEKAGLIVLYQSGGKPFLKVLDTRWQTRSEPKYPLPTPVNNRSQVKTVAPVVVDVVVVEDVVKPIASSANALSAGVNGNGVAYIPLNDGTEFGVSKEFAEELQKLYPAVDVPQTLNEIRGWNMANPSRRKTKRGVMQHINAWMSKEQNRGPAKA